MQVTISQPPKSAMQSGRSNAKKWLMEFDPTSRRRDVGSNSISHFFALLRPDCMADFGGWEMVTCMACLGARRPMGSGGKRNTPNFYEDGRGSKIRTCDPLYPKQVRYQAAPCPDRSQALGPESAGIILIGGVACKGLRTAIF